MVRRPSERPSDEADARRSRVECVGPADGEATGWWQHRTGAAYMLGPSDSDDR